MKRFPRARSDQLLPFPDEIEWVPVQPMDEIELTSPSKWAILMYGDNRQERIIKMRLREMYRHYKAGASGS